MLLTCNRCLNTYVVDDQVYLSQPQNCLCEQCQVPLSPLSEPQPDPIPGQDWPQQPPQQPAWQQPQQPAWQQQQQPAWQQQEQPAWQQPQQPAWQQQQQPAWQQPQQPAWQQQEQPAWQQQQQPAWQQQQQPAWQQPQPSGQFDAGPVIHSDNNEKTTALDLDVDSMLGLGAESSLSGIQGVTMGQPFNPSGVETCAIPQPEQFLTGSGASPSGVNHGAVPSTSQQSNHVVVGQNAPAINESSTKFIDIDKMPSVDDPQAGAVKKFFNKMESIPRLYLIIAACGAFAIIITILIIIIVTATSGSDDSRKDELAENQTEEAAPVKKSFEELVESAQDKVFSIPMLNSTDVNSPTSGTVIAIAPDAGIYYNDIQIAESTDALNSGASYIDDIAKAIKKDTDGSDDVYLFFDENMKIKQVYKVLYTVFANQKTAYIAGIEGSTVIPFKYGMYKWPSYGTHAFRNTSTAEIILRIEEETLTLSRLDDDPLVPLPDDAPKDAEPVKTIKADIGSYSEIDEALSNYKGASYIILEAYPDCPLRVFLKVTEHIRGSVLKPNFKNIAFSAEPFE